MGGGEGCVINLFWGFFILTQKLHKCTSVPTAMVLVLSRWFYSHDYLCMLWLAKVKHGSVPFCRVQRGRRNPSRSAFHFWPSTVWGGRLQLSHLSGSTARFDVCQYFTERTGRIRVGSVCDSCMVNMVVFMHPLLLHAILHGDCTVKKIAETFARQILFFVSFFFFLKYMNIMFTQTLLLFLPHNIIHKWRWWWWCDR